MKKFLLVCIAALFLSTPSAFAARYLFETKIGHFMPCSKSLKKLYDNDWDDYAFEISVSPYDDDSCSRWRNFFAWGSYNHIFNRGFTFSGFDDTEITIQLGTISIGAKYVQPLRWNFDIYGCLAPRYVYLLTQNRDDAQVEFKDHARGFGSTVVFGFLFHPTRRLLIDFYANWMFKHFNSSHFSFDLGTDPVSVSLTGVSLGIGFGLKF